jgi:hypothetical protein
MRILTRRDTGLLTQWTFGSSAFDSDAQAFFVATGITDPTQQSAVNSLVVSLKNNSIWSKFVAIYPMVGGTSTTCKFNLINPADTNAAFRLNFVGGWTFSSTGATPNGTNAYADTFIVPSTTLLQNDVSMGLYSGTDVSSATVAMGSNSSNTNLLRIYPRHPVNTFFFDINDASVGSLTNADGRGFLFGTRLAAGQKKGSIRGTLTAVSATSNALSTFSIYLGAQNFNGTASIFSPFQHRLSFIGRGLTDTEAANFHTAVQTFQTTLGRQI